MSSSYLDGWLTEQAWKGDGMKAKTFRPPSGMNTENFETLVARLRLYRKQGLLDFGEEHRSSEGDNRLLGVRDVRLTEKGVRMWRV